MALAAVQVAHTTGVSNVTVVTLASATTVGNRLIVTVAGYTGTPTSSTLTDSKGNTWTLHLSTPAGAGFNALYSAPITTGGASHTVTYNDPAGAVANVGVIEVSGVAASSFFDKTSTNSGGGTPPFTTGSTGTLSQADEIAIAVWGVEAFGASAAITQAAGWTLIGEEEDPINYTTSAVYQIVSATTALNCSWTTALGAGAWLAYIATFKAATGGGAVTLVIADCAHGHTAETPTLATPGTLGPSSCTHGHTAEVPGLGVSMTLVNNSAHAHYGDNATVALPTIVTDDFNRANSNSLGLSWIQPANTDFRIVSNTAHRSVYSGGGSGDFCYWNIGVGSSDMFAEADVSGILGSFSGLTVRVSGGLGVNNVLAYLDPFSNTATIEAMVGGGTATIASATFVHGDAHHLRLESQGNTHRLYVDGVLAVSGTSSAVPLADKAGINGGFIDIGTWDNFYTGVLATTWTLAPDNGAHGHTAGNVTLSIGFQVDSAFHAHTATQVLLPVDLAPASCTHGHTAANVGLALFTYPVSVDTTRRKMINNVGGAWQLRCISSWAMTQTLSNAQITQALEGVAARHFNSVIVEWCGWIGNTGDYAPADKFQNKAGQPYWATTAGGSTSAQPFLTSSQLGAAWSSYDWMVSEATRLNLVVGMSLFISQGYGSPIPGQVPEIMAVSPTDMYNSGLKISQRYASVPNMFWHLMGDDGWSPPPGDTLGTRIDAFWHGVRDGEGSFHRLLMAEPVRTASGGQFIGQEQRHGFANGYQYFLLSCNSLYNYTGAAADDLDSVWAEFPGEGYPVVNIEPAYIGNPFYGAPGSTVPARQQFREQSYAAVIRGNGINWSHENWWQFGKGILPVPGVTWDMVPTEAETFDAQYAWDFAALYCDDLNLAQNEAFVVSGLGSGDTRAICAKSPSTLIAYFPTARTVTVNTTVIAGTNPVRLRWYDPSNGNYLVISSGEARSATRTITYPNIDSHGDGNNDWLLVVDDRQDLGPSNANHGHTAGNVLLSVGLNIASCNHGHTAENVTLNVLGTLSVSNANHGHTADNVLLSVGLIVDNSAHGHTAQSPTLTLGLQAQGGVHGHTADNIVLITVTTISVANCVHGHLADNVPIDIPGVLTISPCFHGHTADNVAITSTTPQLAQVYLGATHVSALKLGATPILRAYVGTTRVLG